MASGRRDLVLVSAELDPAGGGTAAVGRLLAASAAGFARDHGIGFEILRLAGHSETSPSSRSFAGRQGRLGLEIWRRQLAPSRPALLFDLLGPARLQAYLPAALRSPYLVFLHGIEVWRHLGWDRSRTLRRATVRLANSAHTVAEARRFNTRLGPVEILPLALEQRPPAGASDGGLLARAGQGFLLIVGRMSSAERYKGHDELLEAMPLLLGRCPATRLVVAGDGDDRHRLESKAADLGVGERVLFAGFVSEATLTELYRRAAVFVMPSRGEGFGLVYLEAMRAGKPCVAASGGAAEEIVVDGETGLLIDPTDREALVAALVSLLSCPDDRRRLGEAGRERWQRQFGTDRFDAHLRPHLDRLTSRNHVRD